MFRFDGVQKSHGIDTVTFHDILFVNPDTISNHGISLAIPYFYVFLRVLF